MGRDGARAGKGGQVGAGGLLLPVYLPTALLAFGQGLLVPTLPFYGTAIGASASLVGFIVAAAGLGTLAADIPSGVALGRLGRRPAMLLGAGIVALSTLAAGLSSSVAALVALRLAAGAGTALWGLSRHAFITDVTAPAGRGRAIAIFGGINRTGNLLAPAFGGFAAKTLGLSAPFFLAGAFAAGATLLALLLIPESGSAGGGAVKGGHRLRWGLVGALLRTHWRDLSAAGVAQIFAQMIRAGRQLLIPLYGLQVLGLDVAEVGTIVSIAAALDVAMFFPAGLMMDRFGRKVAAVPSFSVMAVGMALMTLAGDYRGLLLAAAVIGFGNGLGSGTMMTLGADLAPPGAVGEFLGFWRLIGDAGQASGPLVVGAAIEQFGASEAALLLSGIGVAAALTLALLVRETRTAPAAERRGA